MAFLLNWLLKPTVDCNFSVNTCAWSYLTAALFPSTVFWIASPHPASGTAETFAILVNYNGITLLMYLFYGIINAFDIT
jgi:hypothetical protein